MPFLAIFILEEPESNLHPAFQSKLAELLVDAGEDYGIQFIVETHSEYLIRKLQNLTAKGEINTQDTAIYYFNNVNSIPEGEEQIKRIEINKYGGLTDNFGSGFIDEANNLQIDLLKLNMPQKN